MKPIILAAALGICAVLPATLTTAVRAAEPISIATPLANETIELRNVKPSVMAYWLNAAHSSPLRDAIPLQAEPEMAVLPKGIENLIPIDSQNSMQAFGTADGIAKLRLIATALDKPIPQFQIEFQVVEIPQNVVLNPQISKNASSNPEVEAFDGKEILGLIAAKKATVVSAPRVTTFNKMTSQIASGSSSKLFAPPYETDQTSARSLTVNIGSIFNATPTLNRANGVDVVISYFDGFSVIGQSDKQSRFDFTPLPSTFNRSLQTTLTFPHDAKDFIALRNTKKNDEKNQCVLLVRATPYLLNFDAH